MRIHSWITFHQVHWSVYWDNKTAKKRSYLCSVRQVGGHDRDRQRERVRVRLRGVKEEGTWNRPFGRQHESIRLYYTHTHICLHTNKQYCACIYKRINVIRMYYILYIVLYRCQKRYLTHEEKEKYECEEITWENRSQMGKILTL
jgi:hypothetical protein